MSNWKCRVQKWRGRWRCRSGSKKWRFDDLLFHVGRVTQAEPLSTDTDTILAQKVTDQAIRNRKTLIVNAGERFGKNKNLFKERQNPPDPPFRANPAHLFPLLLARLHLRGGDTSNADEALKEGLAFVCEQSDFSGSGESFAKNSLARLWLQFGGSIGQCTDDQSQLIDFEEKLKTGQRDYGLFLTRGTENQANMHRTAGFLFGESFPNENFAHDDSCAATPGSELTDICLDYMCKYGKELYKTGMNEYLSPPYHSYNSAPWLNIVEYAQSAEARLIARAILDWMLADYALNYHHGILLPPVQRAAGMLTTNVYTDKNGNNRPANRYQKSHAHTASQWTGWLYWGGSNTPEDQTAIETDPIYKIYRDLGTPAFWQSVSECVPHRVIRNIGAKRVDTPYTIWQTRGNRRQNIETQTNSCEDLGSIADETPLSRQQMRSVYVSRNYALGAGYRRKDIRDPYNRTAFPFAVVWKSSNPLNWLTVAHPYWYTARPFNYAPASEEQSPNTVGSFDWAGVSPFGQMVHWENCAVLLYDIPNNDPYDTKDINAFGGPLYKSQRTATPIQSIYVYFPETLGEPVERSGWWFFNEGDVHMGIRPFPGHANKKTDGHEGFNRLAIDGSLVGVVIEVGDAREYGSFAKFQKTIIARTKLDLACLESERRVQYVSTRRHILDLKHRTSEWLPKASVNCAKLDFDRWPRSLSPYVKCENGVLDVNDGQEGFTINWQADFPVYEYYDLVDGQKVPKSPPQSSCW